MFRPNTGVKADKRSLHEVNYYYGFSPVAFGFQVSVCPPLADNFIYGLPLVVLWQKNK
jgi:hypothetical protein